MAQFYMNLPSNASLKTYPKNTLASYTTHLPSTVQLNGQWEVALVEVSYPRTWYNITAGQCYATIHDKRDNTATDVHIPEGYYHNVEEILSILNDAFHEFGNVTNASFNSRSRKVSFGLTSTMTIILNKSLADILGFEQLEMCGPSYALSATAGDINRGCNTLFVYCDVAEDVIVGDTKAPLLRTVNVEGEYGDTVHKIYSTPLYVPVRKSQFDTIEINIRDETGQLVPFTFGRTIVTLHFRRVGSVLFPPR
jgi:hypothetical protein